MIFAITCISYNNIYAIILTYKFLQIVKIKNWLMPKIKMRDKSQLM